MEDDKFSSGEGREDGSSVNEDDGNDSSSGEASEQINDEIDETSVSEYDGSEYSSGEASEDNDNEKDETFVEHEESDTDWSIYFEGYESSDEDETSPDKEELVSSDEDFDYSCFENKLDYMSITKIDTSSIMKNKTIKDLKNLKVAKNIMQLIINEEEKKVNTKVEQLPLKKQVEHMLKEKNSTFKVNLYSVKKLKGSTFSNVFSKMVAENYKGSLGREKVTTSFLLFFFRNLSGPPVTPEIFALTTGSATHAVTKFAEMSFVRNIEQRLLEFPYKIVSYKQDGHVFRVSKFARPGCEILLSTWDYLGIQVDNRTRQIRKNSSLYSTEIDAFLSKTGKHVKTKFKMSGNKLTIQRKLNIPQFVMLINHFSNISCNKKTYLVVTNDCGQEEIDDPRYQMYDFVSNVSNEVLLLELQTTLCKVLEDSMTGVRSNIYLMNREFDIWSNAEKFQLQVIPLNRKRYKTIETWTDIPSLDDVMLTLKKNYSPKFDPEWLNNVVIQFDKRKVRLKTCIFSRFSTGKIGTYIYNHGEWIEMKAEYLYQIEREFVKGLSLHFLKSNELPFILPWKCLGRERAKTFKKEQIETMTSKWVHHFETVCHGGSFDTVLLELETLSKDKTNPKLDFIQLERMKPEQKVAFLYRFLECNLNEDSYNAAHTLLNMILPPSAKTKVLTCDKKCSNEIELCDILIFNDHTTYLVHVKAGFRGESIRAVCSQIRNAADNIYRERSLAKGTGIIDKYWDKLTDSPKDSTTHENEVKKVLENMTKETFKKMFTIERDIVFVLACRDERENTNFGKDVNQSLEVNIVEDIKKKFKHSSEIISFLTEEGFLTDGGVLTNKFILEGKNTKTAFIEKIQQWTCIGNKRTATAVFEVLMSGLSKSKSTIAKMEIIKLINDFERFYVGEKKLQLKLLSVNRDFPEKSEKVVN